VVFRGVLCACFSVFHKTDQNRPKNIQNAQNEQNTLCAIQRNTVLCVFLSLRKCLQKTFAKHVKNIAKHPQNTAKHRKTLFFKKHSQNTTKHLQNTRKTPQNTAKHHKTDLLTKQTKLANKPLRSQETRQTRHTYKNRPPRQHNHNGLTLNPMEDYDYDYARRIFISRHACDAREELLQAWEDSYKTE